MQQCWQLRGGGQLSCREEGVQLHFRAVCPMEKDGLYKVWLLGRSGERALLGTLIPKGEWQTLSRTLLRGELERQGCWPAAGGERVLAYGLSRGQWAPLRPDQVKTEDPVLRSCLNTELLFRPGTGGFQLAQPMETEGPMLLAPLFCFARREEGEKGPLLVWDFDSRGWPVGEGH